MEKLKIKYPVICEGKYDKIRLSSVIDGTIITTDGFGIFNSSEKTALLRRLAEGEMMIVATDSDSAGRVIRNFIRGIIPKEKIINVYIPQIKGKERRKDKPSAEGTLGVEGMDNSLLYSLFLPYVGDVERKMHLTKADMYAYGLSGVDGSSEKRRRFCAEASLPLSMSSNALLEAIELLFDEKEFLRIMEKIK